MLDGRSHTWLVKSLELCYDSYPWLKARSPVSDDNVTTKKGDTALSILVEQNLIDAAVKMVTRYKASIPRCSRDRKKVQRARLLINLRIKQQQREGLLDSDLSGDDSDSSDEDDDQGGAQGVTTASLSPSSGGGPGGDGRNEDGKKKVSREQQRRERGGDDAYGGRV